MEGKEELGIIKAFNTEVPTDFENTYTIISSLDREDDWSLGKIDDTYLSLNQFLPIESNYYRILINDNSHRMMVNKYNQDYKKIGYVDLCNADILYLDDSVKYITITIYKYENRQIVGSYNQEIINELQNGLKFSILKIDNIDEHNTDKEQLTGEVNKESLSNFSNYRIGWYKSWGGAYAYTTGSLCTRNLYKVDDQPYVFNVNDSRIALSISEFNSLGKWVKYSDNLLNGAIFKKQPSTAYVGITIKSRKWGVNISTLFENGLKIDLASALYINKTETISLSKASLSNAENWIPGSYLYETGEFIIDPNKVCYPYFCTVEDVEYVVNMPGGYLKMNILELDQNGKVLFNNDLQSGRKWKKSLNTEKIAITVYGSGITYTVSDYKSVISNYPGFGLEKYVKYNHNTLMKDMTAGEFVNTINVGWNLGNSLDSKSTTCSETANLKQELNWGNPYISKNLINYVAQCGFNTIRIPVTWYYNTFTDENGSLRVSQQWLDRVQDIVDYAIANGLYTILNTHHEQPIIYAGTDDVKMTQVLKDAKSVWTDIAERFKTYDEHLSFESYNEVDNIARSWNYSDKAATQMNQLNQVFIDTVRSSGDNNTNRILIVPTLLDGADSRFYAGFKMPVDTVTNKIAVQVHIYTKKFNQDLETDFSELYEFSKKIKAPIIIGEWGTTEKYSLPELRAAQASNFVARAAKFGIKCIWWDNGSDYGIINRRDYSKSNLTMITALMEGSQGIGYEVEQGIKFNNIEQFAYRTPNIKTGKLENTYWGTITTDNKGVAVLIPEGSLCSLNIKTTQEAASVWLQRLLFYDSAGLLVQDGKEIQSKYFIITIPQNAVSLRTSFNSPTQNISLDNYKKYLTEEKIELVVRCFNINDVKKVQLTIMPYQD